MKRNTRKGFTGIELVIVIAIIAILATALIPAFGGLFDSANKTADKQLAKNLNTALLLHNINSEVNDFADVLSAARAEGYLISNLNPTAQGCYLVWESQSNQFLLVDAEEDYKVLFAANTNHPEIGETWHFVTSDLEAVAALKAKGVSVTNVASSVEDLKEALASNVETLYIDESVALDANNLLIIDRDITIELGEASVNSNGVVVNERDIIPVKVTGGHATFNGGVIDAAGEALNTQNEPRHYAVRVENGAKATFNGTTFDLAKYNAQIKLGGIVLLKDVVIEATKVGDRYVLEQLKARPGWVFGGETSGHLLVLDCQTTGDGVVSSLQVLPAMRRNNQSLAELTKDLKLFPQVLINKRIEKGFDWKSHQPMIDAMAEAERQLVGRGRVLIRPSGTEPLLRVMVEADEKALAQRLAQSIADTLD